MAIGPVQLIVLGFGHREFRGAVIAALDGARQTGGVRVLDAIALHTDARGGIEIESLVEGAEAHSTIAELIGLGIAGDDDASGTAAPVGGGDAWDVVADIPSDCSAALVLVEHRWAASLREVAADAGGFRIADGFVSPFDLAEIGLLSAQEAQRLHAQETAGAQDVG